MKTPKPVNMTFITRLCYNKMLKELEKRKAQLSELNKLDSEKIAPDSKANLNFAVWGDPQVSSYMFARETSFFSAVRDIENSTDKLDALVLAGDITENGFKCEFEMVTHLLGLISNKIDNFIIVPGNHDIRMRFYKRQNRIFGNFLQNTKNAVCLENISYCHTKEINGYTFIMMGADRSSFESAYISKNQLEWLNKELKKASGKGKPIFIINHQTLNFHNGLPNTWLGKGDWRGGLGKQSDEVQSIFNKYKNVFFITGHLHFGVNKCTFQDCGNYKCLSVPTVGAGNHGDYSPDAQGYLISVYENEIVFRARIFGKGEYVSENIPNSYITVKIN